MKENLEIREVNHKLMMQVVEHRRRTHELNEIVADLIAKGVRQSIVSESNANEHQLSYGKNLQSLLGSPVVQRDNRVSGFDESDQFSRDGEDLNNLTSPGANQIPELQTSINEHVKSNLKVYLLKTPMIDQHNEIILQIVYSLLGFSKDEIKQISEARNQLPVYKIDEKQTKKARTDPKGKSMIGIFKKDWMT